MTKIPTGLDGGNPEIRSVRKPVEVKVVEIP